MPFTRVRRCDHPNDGRPLKAVAHNAAQTIDDKIQRVAGFKSELFGGGRHAAIKRGPVAYHTVSAGDDSCSHAIALWLRVYQSAGDKCGAIPRRRPSANDCMLRIISRVASVGGQHRPAKSGVRECRPALPRLTRKMWQCLEVVDPTRGTIHFPRSILPQWGGRDGNLRRHRFPDNKTHPKINFFLRGLSIQNELVKLRDLLVRLCFTGNFRAFHNGLGGFDHERTVHHVKRLLWHGRKIALRAMAVRAGEVEGAEDIRKVLTIDIAINRPTLGKGLSEQIDGPTPDG